MLQETGYLQYLLFNINQCCGPGSESAKWIRKRIRVAKNRRKLT